MTSPLTSETLDLTEPTLQVGHGALQQGDLGVLIPDQPLQVQHSRRQTQAVRIQQVICGAAGGVSVRALQ